MSSIQYINPFNGNLEQQEVTTLEEFEEVYFTLRYLGADQEKITFMFDGEGKRIIVPMYLLGDTDIAFSVQAATKKALNLISKFFDDKYLVSLKGLTPMGLLQEVLTEVKDNG